MPFSIRLEGHHAPFEAAVRRKLLWLSRDDDNRLKMNRFHEGLGANPRRSWLNSRNGKIRNLTLQRHFSALTKFTHGESRFCGRKRQEKAVFYVPINLGSTKHVCRNVVVGICFS